MQYPKASENPVLANKRREIIICTCTNIQDYNEIGEMIHALISASEIYKA